MTTYNVLVPVVDLIEAESPEAAVQVVKDRLRAAGFEPHDDAPPPHGQGADAFESEPVSCEIEGKP